MKRQRDSESILAQTWSPGQSFRVLQLWAMLVAAKARVRRETRRMIEVTGL